MLRKAALCVGVSLVLCCCVLAAKETWEAWWWGKYQETGFQDPKWDAVVKEAIEHWHAKRLAKAVAAARKALDLGCQSPVVKFVYGRNAYVCRMGSAPVIRELREAVAIADEHPKLHFIRPYCLNILGYRLKWKMRYEEALAAWKRAEKLGVPEHLRDSVRRGIKSARTVLENRRIDAQIDECVAKLNLSANPSREEVRAFLRKISEAGRGKVSKRYSDPAFRLISRIGREHLDLILINLADPALNVYCRKHLLRIITEQDKSVILDWLPYDGQILSIAMERGWTEDAKAGVAKVLALRNKEMSSRWIRAATTYGDPALFDDLVWHFRNCRSLTLSHYRAVKAIPDKKLTQGIVREEWSKRTGRYRRMLCEAGLDYGLKETLEYAVSCLDRPWRRSFYEKTPTPRELVLKYTAARGTNDDIRRWYRENKDRLVFDAKQRKFVIP